MLLQEHNIDDDNTLKTQENVEIIFITINNHKVSTARLVNKNSY